MAFYVLIRESTPADEAQIGEVVRNAYISNVMPSFINALTREITLQLVVSCAAVMFIFIGMPFKFCFIAIPLVAIAVFLIIYATFYIKAVELMSKKVLQCWVAEAYQPYMTAQQARSAHCRILTQNDVDREGVQLQNLSRKIVGTVAVATCTHLDDSAWLFRLAVDSTMRHKGIGHIMVETVKTWSCEQGYNRVLLAISECQEDTRQLFVSTGFQMKQMYHKQLLGSMITLLMYQLECDLHRPANV